MEPAYLLQQIITTAHDVHRAVRGRTLAAAFERALVPALAARGVRCGAGGRSPVEYRGGGVTTGYQVALAVDGVAVELKVLDGLHATDDDQMLNRLRLGDWERGSVNLNVMVSNRGVRCDVFDLRHRTPSSPAPAVAGRLGPARLRRAA